MLSVSIAEVGRIQTLPFNTRLTFLDLFQCMPRVKNVDVWSTIWNYVRRKGDLGGGWRGPTVSWTTVPWRSTSKGGGETDVEQDLKPFFVETFRVNPTDRRWIGPDKTKRRIKQTSSSIFDTIGKYQKDENKLMQTDVTWSSRLLSHSYGYWILVIFTHVLLWSRT